MKDVSPSAASSIVPLCLSVCCCVCVLLCLCCSWACSAESFCFTWMRSQSGQRGLTNYTWRDNTGLCYRYKPWELAYNQTYLCLLLNADYAFIVSTTLHTNIFTRQLLKCEDLLLFSVCIIKVKTFMCNFTDQPNDFSIHKSVHYLENSCRSVHILYSFICFHIKMLTTF